MKDKTEAWIGRARSSDVTREQLTKTHITTMPAHQLLPVVGWVSTDGHRMHVAQAPANVTAVADERWIIAPIEGAIGAARRTPKLCGNVGQLRAACAVAEAIAERDFHNARANAITHALATTGKPPKRDELADRASGAVVISGAGHEDDVCLNADYVADAIAGLPRHATVEIRCGGALDPAIIVRGPGELAVIMPMRVEADERDNWPKIASAESAS